MGGQDLYIFLTVTEFDGEEYKFEGIIFDDQGNVTSRGLIADVWYLAECSGYTKAIIYDDTWEVAVQRLLKCYDVETDDGSVLVDSMVGTGSGAGFGIYS